MAAQTLPLPLGDCGFVFLTAAALESKVLKANYDFNFCYL
jgi:hypothetical protein